MVELGDMFFLKKIKLGNIYACVTGKHAGKFLLYMDSNSNQHGFLTIPTMENLWVPKDEFDFGLKNDILEFVERAPKHVKKTANAKWIENKENIRSTD